MSNHLHPGTTSPVTFASTSWVSASCTTHAPGLLLHALARVCILHTGGDRNPHNGVACGSSHLRASRGLKPSGCSWLGCCHRLRDGVVDRFWPPGISQDLLKGLAGARLMGLSPCMVGQCVWGLVETLEVGGDMLHEKWGQLGQPEFLGCGWCEARVLHWDVIAGLGAVGM